jgi:hypothetical protein
MVVRPAAALQNRRASLRFGTFTGVPKRRLFIFLKMPSFLIHNAMFQIKHDFKKPIVIPWR